MIDKTRKPGYLELYCDLSFAVKGSFKSNKNIFHRITDMIQYTDINLVIRTVSNYTMEKPCMLLFTFPSIIRYSEQITVITKY